MTTHHSADRKTKEVPPPPDPAEGYEAVIAYFNKYSTEELEHAGYLEAASPAEVQALVAAAEYQQLCEHGLPLELTRADYRRLSEVAARNDVPAAKLVKQWIKERLATEAKLAARTKR